MYNPQLRIFGLAILLVVVILAKADAQNTFQVFDFIIYDGGTTGSVLAARLSENKDWTVLLLEAGGDALPDTKIPLNVNRLPRDCGNSFGFVYEQNDNYCLAMNNKQCILPIGKGLGGHMIVNDMIYNRGSPYDYNNWRNKGNHGWGYEDVLPFFNKLENYTIPGEKIPHAGCKGPMAITSAKYRTGLGASFIKAGKCMGHKSINYNGRKMTGFSMVQTTLNNGMRVTSYDAYIKPIMDSRPNLVIIKNAHFQKLVFNNDPDDTKVVGVQYGLFGFTNTAMARREVILAASAINTPRYLMLSGIGPADHLKSVGIEVIKDLSVGYNYHDVVGTDLIFLSNTPVINMQTTFSSSNLQEFMETHEGPATSPSTEAVAFLESHRKCGDYPDYEMAIRAGSMVSQPMLVDKYNVNGTIFREHFAEILNQTSYAFTIFPSVLRPKSRGRVMLRSADPQDAPLVNGGFYSDHHNMDMKTQLVAIKKVLKLVDTPAFKKINAVFFDKPFAPCAKYHYSGRKGCHGHEDDEYWECYARHFSLPFERWAGTTKMGPKCDRDAVVDDRLRVHGIRNLRVCSPSVFPQQVSGHCDGPKIMIGEKTAQMIYEDHYSHDKGNRRWTHY